MQLPITIIYVILAAIVAVYTTVNEIQPALSIIELMAPNPGDKYSGSLAFILTWFVLFLPLLIVLLLLKFFRSKPDEFVDAERTGVFVTREKAFQSAIVPFPVYINSKKVGTVDNGKTSFFDLPEGEFTIQVGKRKQASDMLTGQLTDKDQLHFVFRLKDVGVRIQVELEEIANKDSY